MANPVQVFSRNTKWYNGVLRNLTTDLFVNGKVTTTEDRAKDIKRIADKLITKAKKNTLASRRSIEAFLRKKEVDNMSVVKYLTDVIGPKYKDRQGGYVRIIKVPNRRGDNTKMALLELV